MRDWLGRRRQRAAHEPRRPPAPFVVGCFRSGTTLLRLMLDAHPNLAIPPETHFIHRTARSTEKAADPCHAFLDTVMSHHRWEDFCLDPQQFVQRIQRIEPFDLSEALRVFYALYAERFGKTRWGDKTGAYVHYISLIHHLLPEAHFIHIVRDGRDVALSAKTMRSAPSIESTAQQWQERIEQAWRQSHRLREYLEVRFEELLSDTEPTLRKIVAFVQLPWSERMVAYHERAAERMKEIYEERPDHIKTGANWTERRGALHSLTEKPPQRDRIGRWKKEMSTAERKRFEAVAGKTLRKLGYEVS